MRGNTRKVTEVLGFRRGQLCRRAQHRRGTLRRCPCRWPTGWTSGSRGAGVEYDDVGGLGSWRVGAEYRPTGIVTPARLLEHGRGFALDGGPLQHRGPGPPPISSATRGPETRPAPCAAPNRRQVTREASRQPAARSFGSGRGSPSAPRPARDRSSWPRNWYRLSVSGQPALNTATWAMLNLPECPPGRQQLHPTQWRRHHHLPELRQYPRFRDFGHQYPLRRRHAGRVGASSACGEPGGTSLDAEHRFAGPQGPVRHRPGTPYASGSWRGAAI